MATNERPRARQSQLVSTYGIGSLFPAGDQSFMICGLDDWYTSDSLRVEEPRLARSLRVNGFYAPSAGRKTGDIPAVRFPAYHYCPQCRKLAPFWKFDSKRMICADCERDITPSRFVACCEDGHIEDFPFFQWVHRGENLSDGKHTLSLKSLGASSSLSDIVIACSCGAKPHSLEGSFGRNALRTIKSCGGKRPWLPDSPDEACEKPLRALQRGSSNVWFAEVRSTISIPPWSSPNSQFVTENWTVLQHFPEDGLERALPAMIAGRPGLDVTGILDTVRRRKGLQSNSEPTEAELRAEEYFALIGGNDGGRLDTFRCVEVDVDDRLHRVIKQVSKVSRLREVRALFGFTRVTSSPTASVSPRSAKLSEQNPSWLPATEVLGEGIFIRLEEDFVARWEATELARARMAKLVESQRLRALESDLPQPEAPTARFVAIHSFAHALLRELSLDAGYPVGSLRERVFAASDHAGVLIYTASSDAAGSLGGLAALSRSDVLADVVIRSLSRASWCSNDPVCGESGPSGSDGLNLAACHACLLLPETSCEHRNQFLDRVTIIGSWDDPEAGLLTELLDSVQI